MRIVTDPKELEQIYASGQVGMENLGIPQIQANAPQEERGIIENFGAGIDYAQGGLQRVAADLIEGSDILKSMGASPYAARLLQASERNFKEAEKVKSHNMLGSIARGLGEAVPTIGATVAGAALAPVTGGASLAVPLAAGTAVAGTQTLGSAVNAGQDYDAGTIAASYGKGALDVLPIARTGRIANAALTGASAGGATALENVAHGRDATENVAANTGVGAAIGSLIGIKPKPKAPSQQQAEHAGLTTESLSGGRVERALAPESVASRADTDAAKVLGQQLRETHNTREEVFGEAYQPAQVDLLTEHDITGQQSRNIAGAFRSQTGGVNIQKELGKKARSSYEAMFKQDGVVPENIPGAVKTRAHSAVTGILDRTKANYKSKFKELDDTASNMFSTVAPKGDAFATTKKDMLDDLGNMIGVANASTLRKKLEGVNTFSDLHKFKNELTTIARKSSDENMARVFGDMRNRVQGVLDKSDNWDVDPALSNKFNRFQSDDKAVRKAYGQDVELMKGMYNKNDKDLSADYILGSIADSSNSYSNKLLFGHATQAEMEDLIKLTIGATYDRASGIGVGKYARQALPKLDGIQHSMDEALKDLGKELDELTGGGFSRGEKYKMEPGGSVRDKVVLDKMNRYKEVEASRERLGLYRDQTKAASTTLEDKAIDTSGSEPITSTGINFGDKALNVYRTLTNLRRLGRDNVEAANMAKELQDEATRWLDVADDATASLEESLKDRDRLGMIASANKAQLAYGIALRMVASHEEEKSASEQPSRMNKPSTAPSLTTDVEPEPEIEEPTISQEETDRIVASISDTSSFDNYSTEGMSKYKAESVKKVAELGKSASEAAQALLDKGEIALASNLVATIDKAKADLEELTAMPENEEKEVLDRRRNVDKSTLSRTTDKPVEEGPEEKVLPKRSRPSSSLNTVERKKEKPKSPIYKE